MRIGIIICGRYQDCGGGKCFRSMRERRGGFARYPREEHLEVVGYATCGGCPGGNVEYLPAEFKKNGCDAVHLATGLLVGYPPCPNVRHFKSFIEGHYRLPVVLGTHPIPQTYLDTHRQLPFWEESRLPELMGHLLEEPREVMEAYN